MGSRPGLSALSRFNNQLPSPTTTGLENALEGKTIQEMLFHTSEYLRHLGGPEQCRKSHCYATFTDKGDDHPSRMVCSTASGALPLALPLSMPLYYPGNYEWCDSFPNAHYCVVEADIMGQPLALMGQCVSTACSSIDLREKFHLPQLHANLSTLMGTTPTVSIASLFEDPNGTTAAPTSPPVITFRTRCEDDTLIQRDQVGYGIWVGVFLFLVCVVIIATMWDAVTLFLHKQRHSELTDLNSGVLTSETSRDHHHNHGNEVREPDTTEHNSQLKGQELPVLVSVWSAMQNTQRLFTPIEGDFGTLNGIRVISILWVIFGHTVFSYLTLPVANPNSLNPFTQTIEFTSVRGAEFAVDTFFFLSGFLATIGTHSMLVKTPLSITTYLRLIFLRYIRLTPAYALVLFFTYKVAPYVSSGPFWNLLGTNTAMNVDGCNKYWWTNLLYINNIYPFQPEDFHAQGVCMGWAWYLANDFQFFLLVAPIVALFTLGIQYRTSNRFLFVLYSVVPTVSIIMFQLIISFYLIHHFDMNGTVMDPNFYLRFYSNPYVRVTPYAVGIGLGLIETYRQHVLKLDSMPPYFPARGESKSVAARRAWFLRGNGVIASALWVAAFGTMVWLVMVINQQFSCTDQSSLNCFSPTTTFGYFGLSNWDTNTVAWYYAGSYLLWSVCLAIICYCFFSGYGTWVAAALSHPVFTPLSRLTYGAYLVHLGFMYMTVYSQDRFSHFGWKTIVPYFVYYSVVAFVLSYVLYLLVERPCMNILSLVVKRKAKVSPQNTSSIREPLLAESAQEDEA